MKIQLHRTDMEKILWEKVSCLVHRNQRDKEKGEVMEDIQVEMKLELPSRYG